MIDFESPIEQLAYPIIYTISIKYNLEFEYQKKIGYQSGSSMTQEDYFELQGWDYNRRTKNYYWNDNFWESELYRIDFTLESSKMKIAIELDGEQFHKKRVNTDKQKDVYLKDRGYTVLRFKGNEVMKKINKIRENIINLVIQNEIGFIIPKPEPKKSNIIPKHTLDYHIKGKS